jgi:polysaccharide biosynthesis protein PslG
MLRHLLLGGLVFIALLCGVSVQAQGEGALFGVVEGYYRPDDATALGVTWERTTFYWYNFQPTSAADFDTNAVQVDAALGAGRQVVGVIKGTPAWAGSGSPAAVPTGIDLPYNDPGNVFGAFVTRLVSHYAPMGVHHWIIWNEPDIRPGEGTVEFEGEVEDYYRLLRTAYLAANAVDPAAHIQIAGNSWWHDVNANREPYLARLLRVIMDDPGAAANNYYFDGATTHIYFTTTSVRYILNSTQTILSNFGLRRKELWLTEFNASPRRDPNGGISGASFNVSPEQQADFIVQASALALAANVERMAVYRLYDNDFVSGQSEPWGLVRADGSQRPAFGAYQRVIQQFRGATRVRAYSNEAATLVTMSVGGKTVYVMWSDTFEGGEFLMKGAPAEITVQDSLGNAIPQAGGTIAAPGAEHIDVDFVVVSGAVRIVTLRGGPLRVQFRQPNGNILTLN